MSQLLQVGEKASMRDVFGEALLNITKKDTKAVVLDGDLANSTKTDIVAKGNAAQFLQMGIAEQNMMGVAAGLASVGLQPWVCTFASFITKRALDQITVSVAQPKLNVKMIGAYSGLLTGCTGKTHQGVEDVAIMRSIPNMVVLAPADGVELIQMMEFAHQYDGPVYIRLARDEQQQIFDAETHRFELGKGLFVKEGGDLTIITTGTQTERSVEAARLLEEQGINASVLHMPSIKPLDQEAIVKAARETGAIVVAEEHNIIGGLGSAVAEILGEQYPTPMIRVGVQDRNTESGKNEELLKKYNITPADMVEKAKEVLSRKR
ncbi:transketolase family protein [Domibacillus aminovorans]|uniref:Transketolase n=1 Tax=Domibacillus aminovorans TaxID=29332 RepID=A0A177L0P9_9BACI|nr:transketolase C-terminal domain-containing protein [Domibacillus aminovorans]OAH58996.1 transketolase [Domibacillus aminovorans]